MIKSTNFFNLTVLTRFLIRRTHLLGLHGKIYANFAKTIFTDYFIMFSFYFFFPLTLPR
jgi:hypothetical protein